MDELKLNQLKSNYESIVEKIDSGVLSTDDSKILIELSNQSQQIIGDISDKFRKLESSIEKVIKQYAKAEAKIKRRDSIDPELEKELLNLSSNIKHTQKVKPESNLSSSKQSCEKPKSKVKQAKKLKSVFTMETGEDEESDSDYIKSDKELKKRQTKETSSSSAIRKKNSETQFKKELVIKSNGIKSRTLSTSKASNLNKSSSYCGNTKPKVMKSTITPSYPKIEKNSKLLFPDDSIERYKKFDVSSDSDNSESGSGSSQSDSGSDSDSEDVRVKYKSKSKKNIFTL